MKSLKKITALTLLLTSPLLLAAEHQVTMLNNGPDGMMAFEPGFLKIAKGDTVKFVAKDAGHNAESVLMPGSSPAFNTAYKPEVSVTFNEEGVIVYKCLPHAAMAMVGIIQVGAATNKAEAKASVDAMNATFVMNKDRLNGYFAQVK